ncbi:PREDICTED: neither inactivation nor afterpotential protein C-like [Rhagoletis zephyria]|uniref:neither inactivation nor afterpotential protein C-like n=1 Tax=Rhagoletis zephyria TaxID=28612 RepID=UPI0008115052|nr:PREDICTED: neither inactivation nor afterpotential protein C-like [Rhagoletis zephyria]
MNMNAYNNYHQYNNATNSLSSQIRGNLAGSRRNSLKGYSAPPPPPMPPTNIFYRNDEMYSRMPSQNQNNLSRLNQNYQQRAAFIPPDPVRELKDIVRRSNDEDSSEDPPFNFKSLLRKTNYSHPDSTVYEFNGHMSNNNNESIGFQSSKLSLMGRRLDDFNNSPSQKVLIDQVKFANRGPPLKQSTTAVGKSFENTNAKSFEEAGSYVEEEIAPGVTLSGYAVDI